MSLFLNVLLLANVAFLSFPTSILARAIATGEGLPAAACFYGATLTVGGIFFNAFWLYQAYRLEPAAEAGAQRHFWAISWRFGIGPLVYLVATVLSLWLPLLAIAGYVAMIIFFWLPGRVERRVTGE